LSKCHGPTHCWNAWSVPGIAIETPQNLIVSPLGFEWKTYLDILCTSLRTLCTCLLIGQSPLTTFGWVRCPPLTDWPQKIMFLRRNSYIVSKSFFGLYFLLFFCLLTPSASRNIQHLEFQPLNSWSSSKIHAESSALALGTHPAISQWIFAPGQSHILVDWWSDVDCVFWDRAEADWHRKLRKPSVSQHPKPHRRYMDQCRNSGEMLVEHHIRRHIWCTFSLAKFKKKRRTKTLRLYMNKKLKIIGLQNFLSIS